MMGISHKGHEGINHKGHKEIRRVPNLSQSEVWIRTRRRTHTHTYTFSPKLVSL